MDRTPEEKEQGSQTQPDSALSDSELEQVSGGARSESRNLIREFPEIEFGEP